MSIAYEMSAAQKLPPTPENSGADAPLIINGEAIDPFDAMLTVTEAVGPENLEGTGFADVLDLPTAAEQIIAYHAILARCKGVPQKDIDALAPDLTPAKRVSCLLALVEFNRGEDAEAAFRDMRERPAPELTDIFLGDNILPAHASDSESVSRLRRETRTVLRVQGFPEEVIDQVELQVSEAATNVKQHYPYSGGRIWIGRTADSALVVAEGDPLPPNVTLFEKKVADASRAAVLGKRDIEEHGRGGMVMQGADGAYGKFTIARDEDGNSTAYQIWCTTPLPEEFHEA